MIIRTIRFALSLLPSRTGPQRRCLRSLVAVAPLLLTGCAGFGIVATSDPDVKLEDALVLFGQYNRPLPAERLIREAIAIYEERKDQAGLGKAYQTYGIFFGSRCVTNWQHVYRRDGFLDRTVKFEDRFAKAVEYLERSLPLLREAELFDGLTGTYYHLGFALNATGQHDRGCAALDASLEAYHENMARNPTAKRYTGGSASVPARIAEAKQQLRCP